MQNSKVSIVIKNINQNLLTYSMIIMGFLLVLASIIECLPKEMLLGYDK